MTADPKPAARVRLSRPGYLELVAEMMRRCGGRCECGCGRPAHSAHHVIGGSGRSDLAQNIMMLNGDGTRGCHGAFTAKQRVWDGDAYIDPVAVAAGMRRRMETLRRDVRAHVIAARGRDWLDARYPLADTSG